MAFCGVNAPQIIPVAINTLRSAGLRLSRRKLRLMPPTERKIVTGVVLDSKLSVPAEYRKGIRAGIHKLITGQIPDEKLEDYLLQLEGAVSYIRSINRHQGDKLLQFLERAKDSLFLNSCGHTKD